MDILFEASSLRNGDDVLHEIVGLMCMYIGPLLTNEYHDVEPMILVVSPVMNNFAVRIYGDVLGFYEENMMIFGIDSTA